MLLNVSFLDSELCQLHVIFSCLRLRILVRFKFQNCFGFAFSERELSTTQEAVID